VRLAGGLGLKGWCWRWFVGYSSRKGRLVLKVVRVRSIAGAEFVLMKEKIGIRD
jgi:hypothetical protein